MIELISNLKLSMATANANLSAKPESYKSYIASRWVKLANGAMLENRNPADTRDLVGLFPASTGEDVHGAVNAAVRVSVACSATSRRRKQQCQTQTRRESMNPPACLGA